MQTKYFFFHHHVQPALVFATGLWSSRSPTQPPAVRA